MNRYELTLVLDGKSTKAKQKTKADELEKILKLLKGEIIKEENWGVKKMAHKMDKYDTGVYLYFELELGPESVKHLKTKLSQDDKLLRYLLIRND